MSKITDKLEGIIFGIDFGSKPGILVKINEPAIKMIAAAIEAEMKEYPVQGLYSVKGFRVD